MKFKYFVHNKMKYINYIFWFVTIEKISLKNQNQSWQSNHTPAGAGLRPVPI